METIVKSSGAAIGGSSLLGFASSVIKHASGGSKKFTKSDIKKVYFVSSCYICDYDIIYEIFDVKGNWLRDYSQAMDIAGLSKLSADTLVLIVAVLGFMVRDLMSRICLNILIPCQRPLVSLQTSSK